MGPTTALSHSSIIAARADASPNSTAIGNDDQRFFFSAFEQLEGSSVQIEGSFPTLGLGALSPCRFYTSFPSGREVPVARELFLDPTSALKTALGDESLRGYRSDVLSGFDRCRSGEPEFSGEATARHLEGHLHRATTSTEVTHKVSGLLSFLLIAKLGEQSSETATLGKWAESTLSGSMMAVRLYFPRLLNASPADRKKIRGFLLGVAEPRSLWRYAFQEYDRTGKEAFLLHTLSLLEDFGERAWPALKEIANSKREECELFSGAIARCPGVPRLEKIEALRMLASNPSSFVRSGLIEKLSELPSDVARPVLEALSKDNDPDIGKEAREGLMSLD